MQPSKRTMPRISLNQRILSAYAKVNGGMTARACASRLRANPKTILPLISRLASDGKLIMGAERNRLSQHKYFFNWATADWKEPVIQCSK